MSEEDEIEAERQRRLAELREGDKDRNDKSTLEFRYGPGSYGCHEALHMASVILGILDRELVGHPTILTNREWYADARRIQDELYQLYQKLAAVHVVDQDRKSAH